MKGVKLSIRALCSVLSVCIIFFTGIAAFADNDTPSAVKSKHYLEEAVEKMVQEGSLTREKADKILEYKQKRKDELKKLTIEERAQMKKQGGRGSLLKALVQEGIITEEEAKAIREKLLEMKEARVYDGLQGLIDKGVLTKDDINNIRSYLLKVREERKASIEKIKSMTPDERKAYFKEHKNERKDILTKMVEDKVITKEQAEEIRKAIPELRGSDTRP
ncbi:MAG TPA: hypothetical protein PLE05_06030 [Bacillota bacterium]|nr:hypothetical protein [Bacillota bacterium]